MAVGLLVSNTHDTSSTAAGLPRAILFFFRFPGTKRVAPLSFVVAASTLSHARFSLALIHHPCSLFALSTSCLLQPYVYPCALWKVFEKGVRGLLLHFRVPSALPRTRLLAATPSLLSKAIVRCNYRETHPDESRCSHVRERRFDSTNEVQDLSISGSSAQNVASFQSGKPLLVFPRRTR